MSIHRTAVVEPGAELDPTAEVGPFAVIGPYVRLAEGCVVRAHAHVTGRTEVGPGTEIFPFASIGEVPQDLKYKGEPTRLVIGARNSIREYVTIHTGTGVGGGLTSIGDDNLLMIGVHIAHDCRIGHHVIMSNHVELAGHVLVEDYAVIYGKVGIGQFVRIGESAMLAALAGVSQDVAPYVIAQGYPARVLRPNPVNLERRGFSPERIEAVERAFRLIFRSALRPHEAFARVRQELPHSAEAEHMVAFLEKSERGFARVRPLS
jgi:UDP-N-acetylglucosamine acyltransferase